MKNLTRLYWWLRFNLWRSKETRQLDGNGYDAIATGSKTGYLFIHGGGWNEGSRNDAYMNDPIAHGKRRGLTALNTDYPLANDTGNQHPAALHHLETLLKKASKRYGVSKWIVVGASAGANLGALVCQRRPDMCRKFIGYYGCYDLTRMQDFNAEVAWRVPVYTDTPEMASPALQPWPEQVAVTLVHGAADSWVSPQQSRDMADATGCLAVFVPGAEHGFEIIVDMQRRGL